MRTGKTVAVIGSGPAGLAAAEQLNRAGHFVTVFEKSDRIGGLLRYGIPEFKMEKKFLNRRLSLMEQEGVRFRTSVNVGVDVTLDQLKAEFNAIVLAGGAGLPRDLPVPGRELKGIHFAMEYLTLSNKRVEGDSIPDADFISAKGKRVVIIGGGDTGADCLGTVHRQGALSVHQFELLPRPPGHARAPTTRGRCGPTSSACRRRTKRAASACTRCRRSASAATIRGASRSCTARRSSSCARTAGCRSRTCPAPSSRWTSISCCSRWDFSAPSARACSRISASS